MNKKDAFKLQTLIRYSQALYSSASALDGYTELEEESKRLYEKAMEYDKQIDKILIGEQGNI